MNISEGRIASELPKATSLLSELATNANNVCDTIKTLIEKIKNENFRTEQGLSLLELKNQTFMSYLSNLSYTTLLKLSGLPLKDNFSIENLVEQRVVLEKIRPLEDKIKYQIVKYIKVGSEGVVDEGLSEKTNKDYMDNIEGFSDEETTATDSKTDGKKIYRNPHISQVHYPFEEEERRERKEARLKRERMRVLSSSMLRDALEEHTEDPEVHHNLDMFKQKSVKKRMEIERFEEDNFIRITLTKKQKASMNQISTAGTIAKELLEFRSMEGFSGHNAEAAIAAGSRKRKGFKKDKKSKKSFKKRRKN